VFSGDQCRWLGDLPPMTTWCRQRRLDLKRARPERGGLFFLQGPSRSSGGTKNWGVGCFQEG